MLKRLLAGLALALLLVSPVAAARPEPSGYFELSSGPYREGQTLTVSVTTGNVTRKHEVTVGIWCLQPDGTPLPIGNLNADYIYELTSVRGPWGGPKSVVLWAPGTGYHCTARLVAVLWSQRGPIEAWTLDEQTFTVEA